MYHFYDGLWYDPGERRTHDLPCERRTRYRLSQPDTVSVSCIPYDSFRILKLNMFVVLLLAQPKFIVTPKDKSVGLGRAVSLRCQVRGNPPPAVFWNKETSEVRKPTTRSLFLIIAPFTNDQDHNPDRHPENVPIYMGHSLFNTTKLIRSLFIIQ